MFAAVVVTISVLIGGACATSSQAAPVASLPGGRRSTAPTAGMPQAQSDQDFVDYTRCLRSHGVNKDGVGMSGPDGPHHLDPNQGMCRPEMLRATTNRWISEVPSKIV